ncbi:Uncharacterized protein APZ42_013116 [Daphnia magna]|uniref:Uncharacterized protein n=1 Tax=Daphnia magna TaxID=35525 RepID=A0A162R5H6_9CRUS|nr:Uncharacterized protein APZ42_013116 [Daphnia magna]
MEYSSISRTHASAIEPFTLHPNPDSIRYVVGKFLFKFSVLVIHQDFETTNMRIMLEKFKRIFENKRRINNQQFFLKAGRQKTNFADEGPNAKNRRNADDQRKTIDVEEKLYRMESTRKYDIMKRYCPALNQANYLRIEFEMYVGKEVRDFMAKRSEYLSLILKVAQEQEE